MKYLLSALLLICTSAGLQAQTIEAYDSDRLLKRISNNDTLYIVNFWATWCGPCIKELPEFEKLRKAYNGQPVKILLVSLDFEDAYPRKVAAFVNKKKLQHEVVWFSETDANVFIPKIENRWQGSIPATLLVRSNPDYRNFFEGMVSAKRLQTVIDKQLALK